jgi:hypothetical protein
MAEVSKLRHHPVLRGAAGGRERNIPSPSDALRDLSHPADPYESADPLEFAHSEAATFMARTAASPPLQIKP